MADALGGLLTVGIGVALAVAVGAESGLSRQWPAVAGMAAMFGAPGLWFVAAHRRERLYVRTDGIEQRVVWGRSRRLGWSEIERVSHHRMMDALVFEGRDGERIRASGYLVGVLALADLAERRLADRGGDQAAQALRADRVKR